MNGDWRRELGEPDDELISLLDLPGIVEREVQPASSPGVPFVKLAKTNKELFSNAYYRGLIFSLVVIRLRKIAQYDYSEIEAMSPCDLVKLGLTDPIKVFIKQEPHKVAKVKAGKLRIISNVSIVDQLIERILCSKQNKVEIARWTVCPSKPGMGLHDEGLKEIYHTVVEAQRAQPLAETDVSGWDWSVPEWLLKFDMQCRADLYRCPADSLLRKLLLFRGHAISNKVFALSDGSLYAQGVPGVQASGSYNTSSSNSRMRVSLAWLIGCAWAIAMGDDDVESEVPDARNKYEALGFVVKDYKRLERLGCFEFCSTRFEGNWAGYSAQWLRTVYRYLSHSPASFAQNPEYRTQLVGDLRHHPDNQEILSRCDTLV